MHRLFPIAVAAVCLFLWRRGSAHQESHLVPPAGFHAHDLLTFPADRFPGGLWVRPDGAVFIYDGLAIVEYGEEGARHVFTPEDPPVFGSFLRPDPRGESLYFGESSKGFIYQIPLEGPPGEAQIVDNVPLNFDLAFDDQGRGFVSAFDGQKNRILLLDQDPASVNDPVVAGIPGYSGPVAFHEGKLYYATSIPDQLDRVVYFTAAQLEAGIGEGREINFESDLPEGQVVAEGVGGYFGLVLVGEAIYASDSGAGTIDRILPGGRVETFATLSVPGGGFGSVTYLAFRPGPKEFRAGAGPEGGSLVASITDFSSFNDLVEVTPELHFRRGHLDADPRLNLTDAILLLDYLFKGGPAPDPRIAGDVNDDNRLDVSDPIHLLSFMFLGGPEPPAPFQVEGPDPTP